MVALAVSAAGCRYQRWLDDLAEVACNSVGLKPILFKVKFKVVPRRLLGRLVHKLGCPDVL